jgi:hypothetical protein
MLSSLRQLVSSVPPHSPRAALRAAIAARTDAERVLAAAKERAERIQSVIDAADVAELTAKRAQRGAQEAAREWALLGGTSDHRAHHEAHLVAREAQSAAERARLEAQGAAEALPRLKKAQQDAEYALAEAKGKARTSAAELIFAEAQPLLERLQCVAAEIPSVIVDVRRLRLLQVMLAQCSSRSERCQPLLEQFRKLEGCVSSDTLGPCRFLETIEQLQRDPDAAVSVEDL